VSVERHAPGIVELPRREGFWLRWRARVGLLPGQVSTAALVQLKRQRLLMLPVLLAFGLSPPLVLASVAGHGATTEVDATVELVTRYSNGEVRVILNDGAVLDYDESPPVSRGDHLLERRRGRYVVGIVVDGRYYPENSSSSAVWPFFLFLAPGVGLAFLMGVWTWRAYRGVKADVGAPTATTEGKYLGSWVWRGATSRLWNRGRGLNHFAGFPVAIAERAGTVSWFAAPIQLLVEVRQFEDAIAPTSHAVTLTYHPSTRAIATLTGSNGASLDLQHEIDALHPATGLQLRVGRRSRVRHLPDL
jgi:hypothetical protein